MSNAVQLLRLLIQQQTFKKLNQQHKQTRKNKNINPKNTNVQRQHTTYLQTGAMQNAIVHSVIHVGSYIGASFRCGSCALTTQGPWTHDPGHHYRVGDLALACTAGGTVAVATSV